MGILATLCIFLILEDDDSGKSGKIQIWALGGYKMWVILWE